MRPRGKCACSCVGARQSGCALVGGCPSVDLCVPYRCAMRSGVGQAKQLELDRAKAAYEKTQAKMGEAKAKLDRLANLDKDIMADPRMAALQRKKVCQVAQIRRGVICLFKHDRI